MKYLPPEMSEWYFPFNWNVKKLWELEGTIERRNIEDLEWHLDIPFWSSERGNGMMFDLRPREVLENPDKHIYHSARIKDADARYPVCITTYKEREIIIDGVHRLAKLNSGKHEIIEVKVINVKSIVDIAIYE